MATELSEQSQRAYGSFFKTFVPYSLDFNYGILNHLLRFRDIALGLKDRPQNFKAISGLDVPGDKPFTPQEYLSGLVGDGVSVLDYDQNFAEVTAAKLITQLTSNGASEPKDNVIYIGDNEGNIVACLTLKDNWINFVRVEDSLGLPKLVNTVFTPDTIMYEKPIEERYPKGIEGLASYLRELDLKVLTVMQDDLNDNFDRQIKMEELYLDDIETATKASSKVRKMCELASQEFVLPSLAFRENSNGLSIKDEDMILEGNCVEMSCATAMNSLGGIDGRYVLPRIRKAPKIDAMKNDDLTKVLRNIDPLSHQSLASRLFGNEHLAPVYGVDIQNVELCESGNIVSVPGHAFFARQEGEVQNVYDLATGFVGELSDYRKFLRLLNLPPVLLRETEVTGYSAERTDFMRSIRDMYSLPEVVELAGEIYKEQSAKQGYANEYLSWNASVAQLAKTIPGKIPYIDLEDALGSNAEITAESLRKVLENTDIGFVCFNKKSEMVGTETLNIVFKSGDNLFLADGPKPNAFRMVDFDSQIFDMANNTLEFITDTSRDPGLTL